MSVNLPPDQSLRIYTRDKQYYILLSVADGGFIPGQGGVPTDFSTFASSGAHIFTEGLGLTSTITSPHGLTISAHSISSRSGMNFSTAGVNGEDQSTTGSSHPAENGGNAGPLNFYIHRGTDDNASNLEWIARGGDGGDTIVSGGQGGNGGNGGTINRIFNSWYRPLFTSFAAFLLRDDITQRDPNTQINKADSVYIAALDLTNVSTDGMTSDIISSMQTFHQDLNTIANGGSCTLHDLTLDVKRVRNALVQAVDHQYNNDFAADRSIDGGSPGSGKGVVGYTGSFGHSGTDNPVILPLYDNKWGALDNNAALRKSKFAFVHPEQCDMLLTRANLYYYMGSPTLAKQAGQLYNRILDRLSFLPDLTSSDPLYQAYASSSIMPSDWLTRLNSISKEASQQLVHLAAGVDFNGFNSTWVPRASYVFYKDIIDSAIDDLVSFENAYIAYSTALKNQQELQDAVGQALHQTDRMISSIQKDIDDCVSQMQASDNAIQLLNQPVLDTHSALLKEYDVLKDRIKNSFHLSVPQMVNALNSLAFAPKSGMGVLQFTNLIWEGFNEVPNIDGVGVNKDVLIGKLEKGEASVKGITDVIPRSKLDGTFQLDDPFETRLFTLQDQMESFLENYATSSFADVIKEIKDKWDAYIKAVKDRNEAILNYNAALKVLIQKHQDKQDFIDKRNELQGRVIKYNDPDLPQITAYMDKIYQASRARVMKLLNLLIRSLNFRMLDENDIFDIAFKDGDVDSVPLTVTSTVLRNARSRVEDQFSAEVERWGSEPSKFPPDFSSNRGKRIKLKAFELTTLKSDVHMVDVEIPPVFRDTKPSNDFSACCNVRVYKVRFVFDGLQLKKLVKSARVSVHLTHKGTETFVDNRNLGHTYTHDPVKVVYSFNLNADGTIEVMDDGNIAEADVNNVATSYAAPGPFATWTVDLTASELNKLDFSGVKGAYIDFCGTDYAA